MLFPAMEFNVNANIPFTKQQAAITAGISQHPTLFLAGKSFCIPSVVLAAHSLFYCRYYPLNQQFTSHLAQTGMYRNYSLNTSFDKPFCNQF